MSKYVIRLDGRHVWNPSNFGISLFLLLYPFYALFLVGPSFYVRQILRDRARPQGEGSLLPVRAL